MSGEHMDYRKFYFPDLESMDHAALIHGEMLEERKYQRNPIPSAIYMPESDAEEFKRRIKAAGIKFTEDPPHQTADRK